MRRFFFFVLISCLIVSKGFAQSIKNPLSTKDSLAILSELMQMLDSANKPVSYFYIGDSYSNRLFSVRNNLLKTKQTATSKLVYTPNIGYFNKTGLSLSAAASIVNDGTGLGITQFTFTPAYELLNHPLFDLSVSYTGYVVKDKYSAYSSPVQNDIYASFSYKKPFIEPGIAIGYSSGTYNETYYWRNRFGARRYDSVTNRLNSYSVMLYVSHHFNMFELFNKKDMFAIVPSLVLNAGASKIDPSNKTNATLREIRYINSIGRLPKIQNNSFGAESIGVNTDITYSMAPLTVGANVYADYFLPQTTGKKVTAVFTLNIGFSF